MQDQYSFTSRSQFLIRKLITPSKLSHSMVKKPKEFGIDVKWSNPRPRYGISSDFKGLMTVMTGGLMGPTESRSGSIT